MDSLDTKVLISVLASSSLLDGRAETKLYQVRFKFHLQTLYALDVSINKSGASRQFKGCGE